MQPRASPCGNTPVTHFIICMNTQSGSGGGLCCVFVWRVTAQTVVLPSDQGMVLHYVAYSVFLWGDTQTDNNTVMSYSKRQDRCFLQESFTHTHTVHAHACISPFLLWRNVWLRWDWSSDCKTLSHCVEITVPDRIRKQKADFTQ